MARAYHYSSGLLAELAALLEGSVMPYLKEVRDLLAEGWETCQKREKAPHYDARSRWHSTFTRGARSNGEAA
jgi:hypothetical protein